MRGGSKPANHFNSSMKDLPRKLREELRKSVPHLKLIIPAAVALVWLVGRIRRRRRQRQANRQEAQQREEEAAGRVVDIELPARSVLGPQLRFAPPRALRVTLLHVKLPVPVEALWTYLFSNSSDTLVAFHRQLGDAGIELAPWRQPAAGGPRSRVLRFATPVRNPLVQKQVFNRETLTAAHTGAAAFVVSAACTSQGAPFASAFVNSVQWVATAEGSATWLHVTGECNFVTPVWGPLKGTIERESIKGMVRAYTALQEVLAARYGLLEATALAAPAPTTRHSLREYVTAQPLREYFNSHQMNPAVLVVMVAMFVLFWRMAMMDGMALQTLRRLTTANQSSS